MSDPRPDPLVSADVDISGMAGFMMDVQRLFASELWAVSTGDEFKAAMALWGRAWQQTPAGSLPNDERLLAAFSGAGSKWKKVRGVALRGFIECSDGRLYHKTLCEDVNVAWCKRVKYRERTAAATAARSQRNDQRNVGCNDPRNVHPVDRDRGQGTVDSDKESSSGSLPPPLETRFENLEATCREATGWKCPSGFGSIAEIAASGVSVEGRILPVLRALADELRDRGKPAPKSWVYAAKAISDPLRPAIAEVSVPLEWVPKGSENWQFLLDRGKKEGFLNSISKEIEGVRGVFWRTDDLSEAARRAVDR